MPFSLKNARVTFTRLITKVLASQLDLNVKAYVDDIMVKSTLATSHVVDLQETFTDLRSEGVKLNPEKCAFSIKASKLLGFLISKKGIEVNPEKIQAIQ